MGFSTGLLYIENLNTTEALGDVLDFQYLRLYSKPVLRKSEHDQWWA
jgi:hypothetical protein